MGKLLYLIGILAFLDGCFVAPLFEPVRLGGFTASSRRALLPQRVDLFHRLLQQNKLDDAITIAESDSRDEVRRALEELAEDYTITGASIKKRADQDDSAQSVLTVILQRFKVGNYTLEDVKLAEVWSFSHSDGWLIKSLSEVKR